MLQPILKTGVKKYDMPLKFQDFLIYEYDIVLSIWLYPNDLARTGHVPLGCRLPEHVRQSYQYFVY